MKKIIIKGKHNIDSFKKETKRKNVNMWNYPEEVLKKEIRVNSPLKYGGYSFFQTSYDTIHHDWSGIQIVKDPGVPIVYLGFLLLIVGLVLKFYINPLLRIS